MEIPLKRRIFCFAVRERSRLITKSGLYIPESKRGMNTRAEDLWVLSGASDCLGKWHRGMHVIVSDGFELEPVNLELWDKYRYDPEFEYLLKFSERCEGKVTTCIIHEDSVLGEVLGDLIQDDPQW